MDSILANIMKVQGVTAAAVFGLDNTCLDFAATEQVYEPFMLLAAARSAEENLDIFRTIDKLADATSFTCELEHGYFLYRHSGGGRLAVMAVRGVNIAMLDVAVGVTALKLGQAEQRPSAYAPAAVADHVSAPYPMSLAHLSGPMVVPQITPQPPAAAFSAGTRTSNRFAAPVPQPLALSPAPLGYGPATGSQPMAPVPGSRSGISPQHAVAETWTPDELLPNGARVPGTVGPSVMQHVLRALAQYLGGHAKAVIIQELAQLGATPATTRPELFTDFIHNVAERIPDPGMHDEFVKLALGDRR